VRAASRKPYELDDAKGTHAIHSPSSKTTRSGSAASDASSAHTAQPTPAELEISPAGAGGTKG